MAEIGDGLGTSFPGALDTNSTQEVNSPNVGKTKARKEVVEDLSAAVVAVETALGTDPKGTAASVKDFIQKGHNTNGTHKAFTDCADYASLNLAVAAVSGNVPLINYGTTTLTANLTIGASVTFYNYGVIATAGYTFQCNGLYHAPNKTSFSGFAATDIKFGRGAVDVARPRWFGAAGNGTTDDVLACQTAINTASWNNCAVDFGAGVFKCSAPLYLFYDATLNPGFNNGSTQYDQGRIRLIGTNKVNQRYDNTTDVAAIRGTVIYGTGTDNTIQIKYRTVQQVDDVVFEDIAIWGVNTTEIVFIEAAAFLTWRNVYVRQYGTGHGIRVTNWFIWTWINVEVHNKNASAPIAAARGVYLDQTVLDGSIFTINTCRINGFGLGMTIGGDEYTSVSESGRVVLNGAVIGKCGAASGIGLRIGPQVNGVAVTGCIIGEGGAAKAIQVGGESHGISITGNYLFADITTVELGTTIGTTGTTGQKTIAHGISVTGNRIYINANNGVGLETLSANVAGITIFGNEFACGGALTGTVGIKPTASAGVFIGPNVFTNIATEISDLYAVGCHFVMDSDGIASYRLKGKRYTSYSAIGNGAALTWRVGDVVFNTTPTLLKNISHWTCITAGSPGVWTAHGCGLGATGNRPAPTANEAGYLYYNTDTASLQFWNGSAWVP